MSLRNSANSNHLDRCSSYWVIAQKLGDRSIQTHVIVRCRDLESLGARATSARSNNKTAVRIIESISGLHSIIQSSLIGPAVDKHSMQTIPRWVAHRVHEFIVVVELGSIAIELIEERVDCDWVRRWANSEVVSTNSRVSNPSVKWGRWLVVDVTEWCVIMSLS
jgi:hypothetical protein